MKQLLFFLLLISIGGNSAEYPSYILSIEEEGRTITLNDGFVWEVRKGFPFFSPFRTYRERVQGWSPGDEIALRYVQGEHKDYMHFYLTNLAEATPQFIPVDYQEQSSVTPLAIVSIQNRGHDLVLSDGSQWQVGKSGWSPNSRSWQVGQRLHICRGDKGCDYRLLNFDYGLQRGAWYNIDFKILSCVKASLVK